jgi:glycosyltransferase involved in cell wall biosynthesis
VVAYDVGGIAEVIKDGRNGFLIPAMDWQLFAERLEQLVNDQALYKQLSLYEDPLDEFSISSMVEKHAKLYQSLLYAKDGKTKGAV